MRIIRQCEVQPCCRLMIRIQAAIGKITRSDQKCGSYRTLECINLGMERGTWRSILENKCRAIPGQKLLKHFSTGAIEINADYYSHVAASVTTQQDQFPQSQKRPKTCKCRHERNPLIMRFASQQLGHYCAQLNIRLNNKLRAHHCPQILSCACFVGPKEKAASGRLFFIFYTPTGFAFSGSILYCLIARATSLPVILPSFASAAMAAWAM